MKTLKFIVVAALAIIMGMNAIAQTQEKKSSTKTESIKVSGVCDMCKSKIEKAAKIDGVSKAEWNDKTKVLTLIYDPAKVKSDDVQKRIADSGYDTEKFKAEDKAYNGLPGCCKYR